MDELAAHHNWRKYLQGYGTIEMFEVPLFSDSRFVGELRDDRCPIEILNAGPRQEGVAHTLSLRVRTFDYFGPGPIVETKTGNYHGGWLGDEVAALLGLLTGTRLAAGPSQEITMEMTS